MGLDMYMTGKRYISDYRKEDEELSKELNKIEIKGKPENIEIKKIEFEVGYWRKANAIHGWFVENVQDGEDNCREYEVPREKVYELLKICQKISLFRDEVIATKLLPPTNGFFFGNSKIDEFYYADIDNTIPILKDAIELIEDCNCDIYYQASW